MDKSFEKDEVKCNLDESFSDDEIDVGIDLLVHLGFLTKETLPNGKEWFKRTGKQLPKSTGGQENA